MKFSFSWLKEYIDVDLPAEQIGKMLTSAGLEVDDIQTAKEDSIFEVSLTPNLGHCASLLGIAREISAAIEKPVTIPVLHLNETGEPIENLVKIQIDDTVRCPRYACRLVQNIKIAPSPSWMQERLLASGIRPVNNIVDITNYVLLEFGQPLHAFDFDKLQEGKIIVRTAHPEEKIITIDGKERELESEDLLICDAKRAVAIAGVMGGENSEVDEKTCNVLIESANFSPIAIRRTSKRLGLHTDASKLFERNVDPNGVLRAVDRAAQLMEELGGGKICKGAIDKKETTFHPLSITCRLSRINQLLGTQLGVSEVENLFHRLDFVIHFDGKDTFSLRIPTYRADVKEEVDIIEEVARIYGYDNIPVSLPRYHDSTLPNSSIFLFERQVRARLLAEGLQELLTCDLIGPTLMNTAKECSMPEEATIRVLNPTSIEQSILRTSLLPGLLHVVKYNYAHQNADLSGFEIGRIHFKDKEQYKEQSVVGIIMTGRMRPHHWKQKSEEVDFYDLKGVVEALLEMIGIKNYHFKKNGLPSFHPGRQLAIYVDSLEIGSFGEVHPIIIKRLDVPQRVYFAEINLHDIYKLQCKLKKVESLASYPSSTRDLTVKLSKEIPPGQLLEEINSFLSPLLEEVVLLDVYEHESLGKGVCNATYHFVYRDKEKTVEQEAVDQEHCRLVEEINKLVAKGK